MTTEIMLTAVNSPLAHDAAVFVLKCLATGALTLLGRHAMAKALRLLRSKTA
jgi:hypothetical protein